MINQEENYRTWFPQLVEFSESCRKSLPIPGDDELSPLEIGIRRVITQKINELGRDVPRSLDGRALICELPIIAFPAALRLWPEKSDKVLLTPDEVDNWRAKVSKQVDECSWSVRFYWHVQKISLDFEIDVSNQTKQSPRDMGVNETSEPFLICSGFIFGDSVSHGSEEIWAWDGRHFNFINRPSIWNS